MMRAVLLMLFAVASVGCGGTDGPEVRGVADGVAAVPAGPGASGPRLTLDPDGVPVLSWTEPVGDGDAVLASRWTGTEWAPPDTADRGAGRFVNWADTPGVLPLTGGGMMAHVLTRGDGDHAYDAQIRFRQSQSWSDAALLNTDGVAAEHGFVSTVRVGDGAGVVWLDGRKQGGGHGHGGGNMTLRYAQLFADGTRRGETVLDARTCDCCPTALAATASGLVAAYRDRSMSEIRDIAVVRLSGGAWTEPAIPHADGWKLDGCPVNGPALDAVGDRVALAWFTGADSVRVQMSVSEDGGVSWSDAVRVDGGAPIGRVDIAILADGRPAVVWLERVGDAAEVRLWTEAGTQTVAEVPSGRATGTPQIVAVGDRALVAWTDAEAETVRSAVVAP